MRRPTAGRQGGTGILQEARARHMMMVLAWVSQALISGLGARTARAQPSLDSEDLVVFSARAVARLPDAETVSTTHLETIQMSAAPRRSAAEVLRQVPGFVLVQHGGEGKGYQFLLRGFDAVHGADLELTVDGIPLNEWSNVHAQGYLDLAWMIPELIETVVMTKGPFRLEQGAFAMAGSAEYRFGVAPDALGWRASYTFGTTNRHRLFISYAPPERGGDDFVGIEVVHDEGFGENRRVDRASFNARMRVLESDDGGTLDLLAMAYDGRFELPGPVRNDDVRSGHIDFYGTYDPRSRGSSSRGLLGLRYQLRQNAIEVSALAYGMFRRLELLENFTGYLLDPQNGDQRAQVQETWSTGATAKLEARVLPQLWFQAGLGVRADQFEQRERLPGQSDAALSQRRDLTGTQLLAHALSGLRWSPVDTLRVDIGARADIMYLAATDHLAADARGDGVLMNASPRAILHWSPLLQWTISASYGRGFRAPEARSFSSFQTAATGISDELYAASGPSITVSDAFEWGTRWAPTEWFDMSVTAFATFIEKESVFDHVSGISLDLNGTRRVGGEFILRSRPVEWLELSTDLTMVDARFARSGSRVPFAPWLVAGTRATVRHESGFRAGARLLVVAPRTLPHGATGSTLVSADMTLGYEWRWLRLGVEVENVLNQALREGEYHYASNWREGSSSSAIPVLHTSAGAPLNARFTVGVQI